MTNDNHGEAVAGDGGRHGGGGGHLESQLAKLILFCLRHYLLVAS